MTRLAKVQAVSGLGFAVFLAMHLATTVAAVGGPASYDGILWTVRAIYRPHPVVEFLLIGGSAAVHIACAVLQILRRRKTGPHPRPPWRLRLHRWSGYFLMLAIVGHVYATRVMPAIAGGAADFSYLAFSVIAWPYFITPYYFVLGTAGAIHLGLGLGFAAQALAPAGASAALRRASIALAAAAGVLVCAGVAGILMKSAEADWSQFQEYRGLYDRYLPVMPPASREAGG
jgi:succinate dehydrogenase/fumarate reductase cytochrome b subunit